MVNLHSPVLAWNLEASMIGVLGSGNNTSPGVVLVPGLVPVYIYQVQYRHAVVKVKIFQKTTPHRSYRTGTGTLHSYIPAYIHVGRSTPLNITGMQLYITVVRFPV